MTPSVTLSARELDSWLGLWVRIHLEVFEKPTDARLWKEWHAVTIGEEITNDWAVLGETLLEMWEASRD